MKFSKCSAFYHITHELGKMKEIPLGMHPGTIRIEKFHIKTVSILSVLMFKNADLVRISYYYIGTKKETKGRCFLFTDKRVDEFFSFYDNMVIFMLFSC